jgi:hypothetical protein
MSKNRTRGLKEEIKEEMSGRRNIKRRKRRFEGRGSRRRTRVYSSGQVLPLNPIYMHSNSGPALPFQSSKDMRMQVCHEILST